MHHAKFPPLGERGFFSASPDNPYCLTPMTDYLRGRWRDLKIADAGAEESQMALDAGADIVTVLATASDNTIRKAAGAVHAAGKCFSPT